MWLVWLHLTFSHVFHKDTIFWRKVLNIKCVIWCFSDRASWIDYILITNLMHWLLFIHKILFSSTCFEPQEFLVACRYTAHAVYRQATRNSHREWQYHMLHVYNCILLKMSTWGSKHVEENNILWINNNQCMKLLINHLTPNGHYMGRTAPLTSRCCILYIYSTNIPKNILNMLQNLRFFFSSKCRLFHNATFFVRVLFTF